MPNPAIFALSMSNSDGKIDASDRVNLGSFLPKFTYGLNLSANYRGFDMSLFFQGVQGNKIYNGVKVLEQGMLRLFNAGTDVLRAWTPTNTNTDVPRAVDGDPNGNTAYIGPVYRRRLLPAAKKSEYRLFCTSGRSAVVLSRNAEPGAGLCSLNEPADVSPNTQATTRKSAHAPATPTQR